MVRTSITLPADLKARMDKVSRRHDRNWSSIAAKAFSIELDEIVRKGEARSRGRIAARLRASKRIKIDARYKTGRAAGEKWASDWAEIDQLMLLEKRIGPMTTKDWDALGDQTDWSVSNLFLYKFDPDSFDDEAACVSFWADFKGALEGGPVQQLSFVQGFADAALKVWRDVKVIL